MYIYVINLDRSEERLREFRQQNAHMPEIERFSAIDGTTVDRQQLVEANTISADLPYTNGAVGCALSHVFLWEAAASESADITICEDDAVFHQSFRDLALEFIRTLPADWDLVMWGWNFDSILFFDLMPGTASRRSIRSVENHYRRVPDPPLVCHVLPTVPHIRNCLSHDLIEGARKLIDVSLPVRPFTRDFPTIDPVFPNNGIDIVMNAVYPTLNAFVTSVVITNQERTRHLDRTNRPPEYSNSGTEGYGPRPTRRMT